MQIFRYQFKPVAATALVDEIIESLRSDGAACAYVVHRPGGHRVSPNEIWIPRIGVWARADGWKISRTYGQTPEQMHIFKFPGGDWYPTRWQAWRIRRAVRAWSKQHA